MTVVERGAGEVLTQAVQALSSAASLASITQIVAHATREIAGADGATFVLREDESCFYVDEDAIGPLWKGKRFPITVCISGWAMRNAETVLVPDVFLDDRVPIGAYRPTFVKSLCIVPIRAADPIGAMGAYWKTSVTPTPQQVRLLQALANSAAVALENLELRGDVARRRGERDDAMARKLELERAIHTLAHDLRSPIGAIMGFAELLEVDGEDRALRDEYARSIHESGQRLVEQLERMLALYKVTSRPLTPKPVDLTRMGRELARSLSARAGGRRIEVAVQDDLRAVADPVLTHVLLENLLGNAFKYTGKKPEAQIELGRAEGDAPFTTFFVRDNGDGFHPSDAGRLFRPMTRLHSEAEFPGTGLGLASVARIVELHGGQIRAQGEKSVGATFYFTLPSFAA